MQLSLQGTIGFSPQRVRTTDRVPDIVSFSRLYSAGPKRTRLENEPLPNTYQPRKQVEVSHRHASGWALSVLPPKASMCNGCSCKDGASKEQVRAQVSDPQQDPRWHSPSRPPSQDIMLVYQVFTLCYCRKCTPGFRQCRHCVWLLEPKASLHCLPLNSRLTTASSEMLVPNTASEQLCRSPGRQLLPGD